MSPIPHFYYHPRMMKYSFGEKHPLKPVRLERTVALIEACAPGLECIDPGLARDDDILRVHSQNYLSAVEQLSDDPNSMPKEEQAVWGFGNIDNPPFPGMLEASKAYTAASVAAAQAVVGGEPLAFAISGGLHHAQESKASGFCIFNDAAVACSILRDRFERVAYVDIDLHHGDGVEFIFDADPNVLTCSIHETGRRLYPGTGFAEDVGEAGAAVNVPLEPHSTGDTWLWAFRNGIIPALEEFQPQAIVLQMGNDPHFRDPLGHLNVSAQEWLEAVTDIKALGLPIVAVGGGGYAVDCVPRMWATAVLSLAGIKYENSLPAEIPSDWGMPTFSDPELPEPRWQGLDAAKIAISKLSLS